MLHTDTYAEGKCDEEWLMLIQNTMQVMTPSGCQSSFFLEQHTLFSASHVRRCSLGWLQGISLLTFTSSSSGSYLRSHWQNAPKPMSPHLLFPHQKAKWTLLPDSPILPNGVKQQKQEGLLQLQKPCIYVAREEKAREQHRIRCGLLVRLRCWLGEKNLIFLRAKVEARVLTQSQWDLPHFFLSDKHEHFLAFGFTTPGGPVMHQWPTEHTFPTLYQSVRKEKWISSCLWGKFQAPGLRTLCRQMRIIWNALSGSTLLSVFQATKEHRLDRLRGAEDKWGWSRSTLFPLFIWGTWHLVMLNSCQISRRKWLSCNSVLSLGHSPLLQGLVLCC